MSKRKRDSLAEPETEPQSHPLSNDADTPSLISALPFAGAELTPPKKTKRGKRGRGKGRKPNGQAVTVEDNAADKAKEVDNGTAVEADEVDGAEGTAWDAQLAEYDRLQAEAAQSRSQEAQLLSNSTTRHAEGHVQHGDPNHPTLSWTYETIPHFLQKYWAQRYSYFSKFDSGILMDVEGWYSVTPEVLAAHIAARFKPRRVVVDAFCGAGGNAIQFAMRCDKVIAIDIDPVKLHCARQNAEIYGVADKIEFVHGDFFEVARTRDWTQDGVTGIFMSPPWGGPDYLHSEVYNLDEMPLGSAASLLAAARSVTPDAALYLPRNVDLDHVTELGLGETVEVEKGFLNDRCKAFVVYFGGLVGKGRLR